LHLHDRLSVRAQANGVSANRQLTRGYPTPSVSIDVPGETARTVEVRLRGRNCLNLAEIEVYGSGAGGGDRPPLAYGSTWHFAEGAGTTFVWKRRRGTDVIDVVQPDGSPAWTPTNKRNGNQITLDRPDLGHYTGAIAPDGRSASGTATWYSPGQKWAARMSNHGLLVILEEVGIEMWRAHGFLGASEARQGRCRDAVIAANGGIAGASARTRPASLPAGC